MTIIDKLAISAQKGRMAAEQVEAYRKAIAPLQANLAGSKAVRQQAFMASRARLLNSQN